MCSGDLDEIFSNWPRLQLSTLGVEGEGLPKIMATLPLGLSHRSYRIKFGDNDLVLKRRILNVDDLGLDESAERFSQRLAYQAGLAPELIYHDESFGYTLSRFVVGEHWRRDALPSPNQVLQVAKLLRRLHDLPPALETIDLLARLDHYWGLLKAKDQSMSKDLDATYAMVREATESLCCRYPQRRHCHNDLVLENLLVLSGSRDEALGISLIDWEYAAQNDPFFDFAAFLGNWPESEALSHELLGTYLGEVVDDDMRHLRWSKFAYHGLSLLWLALFDGEDSLAFLDQQERLRRL
jgi:thiamine kinase-like enzyme